MNIPEAYAKGFKKGWDKCRDFICESFDLDKEEVIGRENSEDAEDNTNENSQQNKNRLHPRDESQGSTTGAEQNTADANDLCECGHPESSHEVKGFIKGKPTGHCYRNWGQSGCACKKFVKQNKGEKVK